LPYQAARRTDSTTVANNSCAISVTSEYSANTAGVVRALALPCHCRWVSIPKCARASANVTSASQRHLLERTLSQLATWIQDLAPQAQVDITLKQYEDEDAHLYVQPPQGMTAEDVERLELTVGERCNDILLDTGLFIVSAVSG
jgi:hypothetical protein